MGRYNKIRKLLSTFLLLIYMGAIVILNIVSPKKVFSDSENRFLEQLPKFSINSLARGKFTRDYERYVSDQFTLRDFWIGIKSNSERLLGKKESNGVFLGKEGYLLQDFQKPEEKVIKDRVDAINSLVKSMPKINKYFMLVPSSLEIYKDKLPAYAPVEGELKYINMIKEGVDKSINFIETYDTLNSKKDEYIYYRTDHHWTTKGAYYCYKELAKAMGFRVREEDSFNITKITDSFYGSLYSEGGFRNIKPDSIEIYEPKEKEECTIFYYEESKESKSFYNMDNVDKKDKYTIFLNGNYPLIKITTKRPSDKKLLIVKDSYANCFVPFISEDFGEIYMVDLRYYEDSLGEIIIENNIENLLILYNVNTFFHDSSINNILQEKSLEVLEQVMGNYNKDMPQSNEKINLNMGSSEIENTYPNFDNSNLERINIDFKEFFKEDIFLGDSISEGLSYYEYLEEDRVFARLGMSIRNAKVEVDKASNLKPKNIFILYGTNDMDDTMPSERLVNQYRELVLYIKGKLPSSNIYIQSIFPVLPIAEEKNPHINNNHITKCNEELKNMVKEEGIHFVDTASILNGGKYQDLYEGDGIHFKSNFYKIWLSFLVENIRKS